MFNDLDFGWSRKQIVDCQMVFGGLPYFYSLMNPNESLTWNINKLCLEEHAILQNESKKLLEATLKKSPVYNRIMEYLSNFQYGTLKTECQEALKLPAGTYTRAIEELTRCGYVHEYKDPYTSGHPLKIQLIDPFLLFHYKFLSGENREIYKDFNDYKSDMGRYMNWRGHSFEILCMYHTEQIKKALGISGVNTSQSLWSKREDDADGTQIDMIIERADNVVNMCESKFYSNEFIVNKGYHRTLINRQGLLEKEISSGKSIHNTLITTYGLKYNEYSTFFDNVITMGALFDC
jgi:hypothetical protein